jgi:hypothetical protein
VRKMLTFVVLAVALVGCRSSHPRAADPPASTSSTTTAAPELPRLAAVLDDRGLHLPAGSLLAGHYRISFTDRRAHRAATDEAVLQFRPSGPIIVLLEVPAGGRKDAVLISNVVAQVALNGQLLRVPIDHQLDIRPTPEYPTPAT